MADDPQEEISVPVVWVGAEELPVHFLNQFVGVVQRDEVFLTMGTIVPPAIIGETEEDRRAQAVALPFVQVKPIVRVGLTPARLRELIGVLQQTLTNYERLPADETPQ